MKLVNSHKHMMTLIFLLIGSQWTYTQTLTLDQCVKSAVENNKMMELARNGVEISKIKQDQITANRLPKVTIEGDYKYFLDLPTQLMPLTVFGGPEGQFKVAQFGVPHNINLNIQLAIPLYNPQLKSGIKTAKIGIEMAEILKMKTEEDIIFNMTTLYFNAQILLNKLSFINENILSSNELIKTIELLEEQGLLKEIDVDKMTLQLLQLKVNKSAVKGNYDQVLNAIKMLMGISLDSEINIHQDVNFDENTDYKDELTSDVRLAEIKSRLLAGELKTISKSKLPTVVFYGSYGTNGFGYDESPDDFLDFYTIGFLGLKATYPIYSGGVIHKKEKQKQFEIVNSNLQLNLLKDNVRLNVNNAKIKMSTSLEGKISAQELMDYSKRIYDQTIILQKQGMANVSELITADINTRDAQQKYLAAMIDYLKADLELRKWTGNLNKKNIQ